MTNITRRVLAALGFCAIAGAAPPAQAVVRYDLVNQSYGFSGATRDPGYGPQPTFSLALIISDAAVARGSFAARVDGNSRPIVISGDSADFVSLRAGNDNYSAQTLTTPFVITSQGFADIRLSLDTAGNVTSSAISFAGDLSDARLSGEGNAISGNYSLENGGCFGATICNVTGNLIRAGAPIPEFSPVPEPASMALLGFGLFGLAVIRRRA